MNEAILTLAFPMMALLVALVLRDLVRQEQRRILVLRHKRALGTAHDELSRLVGQGRLHRHDAAVGVLFEAIDAVLGASVDDGVEVVPVALRLLGGEGEAAASCHAEAATLERVRAVAVSEMLAILELNSKVAALALRWIRLSARSESDARTGRLHVLASLAP